MNNIDYDKTKFDADSHGNLSPKTQDTTHYKGHKIDIGIGQVKIWDENDGSFAGDFPDVKTAKEHIDTK